MYRQHVKRVLDTPDSSGEEPDFQTLYSTAQREYPKAKGSFCIFIPLFSGSIKQELFPSAPKVYGTIFLRIRGTRCRQLQERFSSLQLFLGFSLFSMEVEEGRSDKDESNTIDFFFFF